MKALVIGDIVGSGGRVALKEQLRALDAGRAYDLVVANGENAAGGFGITPAVADEIFDAGVHVITSGNHVWDKKEAMVFIERERRLLRPLNYPPGVPGAGTLKLTTRTGLEVAVMNASGRVFMSGMDCPFRRFDEELAKLAGSVKVIIVDFHAEATSEKVALGHYLDGRISALIGTHTHVQTADERVLPGGTAYITDVGMTGPEDSVIGVDKKQIIDRFLYGIPKRYEVASGPVIFSAVSVEIDEATGRAKDIKRHLIRSG